MATTRFEIDNIDSSAAFFTAIENALGLEDDWGRDIEGLEDVLCGDYGAPEHGFTVVWKNSAYSKNFMGLNHTLKVFEEERKSIRGNNRKVIDKRIEEARQGRGKTIFEEIVDLFAAHKEDNVFLSLE